MSARRDGPYQVKREDASMRTRDGVRLDADVWRPEAAGNFPILLMRQPYGRPIASTVVYAHPSWYAAQGYIVVIQDVRGRGTSEGEFRIFEQEIADGKDTLDWAAQLPGSTGGIGMYGFSYQGMSQFFAAVSGHPALKALCPAMAGWDVYTDIACEGGAFRLQAGMSWGLQLSVEAARRAGDVEAHQAMLAAARSLPLHEATPAMPAVIKRFGHYGHYKSWLEHSTAPGRYWQDLSPASRAAAMKVPMLHIGGWYDGFLTGTLGAYKTLTAAGAGAHKLAVGPWVHIPWASDVGERRFGPEAANRIDLLQLRWFDHWLKGRDTGLLAEKPVQLFEMGANAWRGFDTWPDAAPMPLYLDSTGRAAIEPTNGKLTAAPPPAGEERFVFDPWRPTPSAGGHKGYPPGPVNRAVLDQRTDVLTFTTAALDADLVLAGDVAVELFIDADRPSFDVCAILSEVTPEGRVLALTEGYQRVNGTPAGVLRIGMRATCARIGRGSALRLSVTPGSFPAHPVNGGDGVPPFSARLIDQKIITLRLRHGGDTPSRLLLPMAGRA